MSAVTTNFNLAAAPFVARLLRGAVVEASGCWRWHRGPQRGRAAGRISMGGETISLRRLAYAARHGQLPQRRVYARCKDGTCVNPAHIYMVPGVDEDGPAILAAWKIGKTHAEIAAGYGCPRERITVVLGAYLAKGGRA